MKIFLLLCKTNCTCRNPASRRLYPVMKRARPGFFLLISLLIFQLSARGYAINDYGSTSSGSWGVSSTWSIWNGAAWIAAGSTPTAADNVHILAGSTVTIDPPGPYACVNLTVEVSGTLVSSGVTNVYISITGNIVCDGTIGQGATFDPISFNIDGTNDTISGSNVTGNFDASRIRKN